MQKTIFSKEIAEKIKKGEIGVIPTDTIYGVAASAWSKKAVERAYKVLKRDRDKPFIVLISSIKDLSLFGIILDKSIINILKKIWPGKVSVVLPFPFKKFEYLHRGTRTLAFRMPKEKSLLNLLKKTGPLISTSANPQGLKPAQNISEAKNYFEDGIGPVRKAKLKRFIGNLTIKKSESKLSNGVDFYVNSGKMKSLPSTLIEIKDGKISIIRKGSGKNPRLLLKNNQ